jgi:Family of unknown function (DUF5677)
MPFKDSGFLSAETPWVSQIRQQYEHWFALTSKINSFVMTVLTREVPKIPEELYVATLYARAVTMFQGAMLLAGLGMGAESRTLVRGCAEAAIALGCTRLDKTFLEQLDDDQDRHKITMANELLNLPVDDPNMSAEQRDNLRQLLADMATRYQYPRPRRINWASSSSAAAMTDLYLTVYRKTSGDAVHVTLPALDRHVASNESGDIVGFRFDPFPADTVDTMGSAIAAILHATEAKLRGLGDSAAEEVVRALMLEWNALQEAEG